MKNTDGSYWFSVKQGKGVQFVQNYDNNPLLTYVGFKSSNNVKKPRRGLIVADCELERLLDPEAKTSSFIQRLRSFSREFDRVLENSGLTPEELHTVFMKYRAQTLYEELENCESRLVTSEKKPSNYHQVETGKGWFAEESQDIRIGK